MQKHRRSGFTLVELLMVILILSGLIAILLPAVGSVMKAGRVAEQRADISSLEGALADFKATFGKYPPSQITLYSSQAGWDRDLRSKAHVRSLWPQFNFGMPAGDYPYTGPKTLTGAECLAFFLGGMYDTSAGQFEAIGFSKNPANPFDMTGTNRLGPFFQFTPDRMSDVDSDDMPELLDKSPGNPAPVLYASSNNGSGYNQATISGTEMCPDLFVYTNDLTAPTNADMKQVYQNASGSRGLNPQSFQLITAGADGEYGVGGPWDSSSSFSGNRTAEADNITNFSPGALGG